MKRIEAFKAFFKNLTAFITGQTITLKQYLELEIKEMRSYDNQHYTRENLHKNDITDEDCAKNYIGSEANTRFRKKYQWKVERPWQKKIKHFFHEIKSAIKYIYKRFHLRGSFGK